MHVSFEVFPLTRYPDIDRLYVRPPVTFSTNAVWRNPVIIGAQGGDEGKGTWVERIGGDRDTVIRFGGGPGAGHEFIPQGRDHPVVHRLLPCAVGKDQTAVIGRGVLVYPEVVVRELENLKEIGLLPNRIMVDEAAFLAWDAHKDRDAAEEAWRDREFGEKIGTTKSGVGPAAADFWSRQGLSMGILRESSGERRKALDPEVRRQNAILAGFGHDGLSVEEVASNLDALAEAIGPYIGNTFSLVRTAFHKGEGVGEGAQGGRIGRLTSLGGRLGTATDIGPNPLQAMYQISRDQFRTIAVLKPVPTVVGTHIIHSPLSAEDADRLYAVTEQRGSPEAGRVSGRMRQFYHLSVPELRAMRDAYGIDGWLISKADIAGALPTLHLGMEYVFPDGYVTRDYDPHDPRMMDHNTRMNLLEVPGWQSNLDGLSEFAGAPLELRAFTHTLGLLTGTPVVGIGFGSRHEDAIFASGFLRNQ